MSHFGMRVCYRGCETGSIVDFIFCYMMDIFNLLKFALHLLFHLFFKR